jgi:peptide/nickel transport system substrate-binding protein
MPSTQATCDNNTQARQASFTTQASLPAEEIMHFRSTSPRSTRRGLIAGAIVTGAGFVAPRFAFAQDEASPSAAGETITSISKTDYRAQIEEEFQYTEAATPGGEFVDSNVNDIKTIHPLLADDADSLGTAGLIYDGLFGTDIRTGQPAPTGLADYWEVAPDRRTYTFHLNKDAKWHDGVDITAHDVQFSFDAIANPELASAYAKTMMDATESWRVIDDDTFEVVAKEPLATFLFDLHGFVIPKHIWEDVPIADWATDGGATGQDPSRVVGSGPFKFEEWRPGEVITAVRNDDYYQKAPYFDRYVIRIWPDVTSIVNAFLNGELDATGLQPSDLETVKATEGLEIANYPTRSFSYYMTNLDPAKTELFQDTRVRQALLYGLDRDSIVKDILLDQAIVAHGTQPVISFAYAPDKITTKYNFDPDKAKALLAEAGWADTDGDGVVDKDGEPLAFEMIYPSGSPTTDQIVAYMQDAWRQIGVNTTPRALEFPALVQAISEEHDFEVALLGFGWDPSFIQDAMFGCEQYYKGGFNMVKYCNEQVDKLNAEAKRTFDEDARRDLIIEATNLVNEDLPVAVMHFSKANVGFSDRLQNYKPGSWGQHFEYVWIQQ